MICITGDTHGDFSRFKSKGVRMLKKGDVLIICGDFGFIWEDSSAERALLKKIGSQKFMTVFADGCHENYELLGRYPEEDFCGGKARHIIGNLYHLSRGYIFNFQGKRFFMFGGGQSAEAEMRRDSHCYWEDELPTGEEMARGLDNLKNADMTVDYIITHEPPGAIKQFLNFETHQISEIHAYFDTLSRDVTFDQWYFGKVHKNKVIPPKFHCLFDDTLIIDTE
ncbi:MAG: hypothetical protein IJ446_06680 [Oscillospiraceae bacterium]|nr:hypothetical protein [Oscillospiraceae bacterium]